MNVALRPAAPTLIKSRRRHTVWFAFLAVALLLFTDSVWQAESLVHENLELAGYAALVVCVLGRIACAVYIGGRKNDEAFLTKRYGDAYQAYVLSVPRWLPDFSRWRSLAEIAVKPRFLLVTMRDSALFFAALPLLEMLDWLHAAGHLLVLLRLP